MTRSMEYRRKQEVKHYKQRVLLAAYVWHDIKPYKDWRNVKHEDHSVNLLKHTGTIHSDLTAYPHRRLNRIRRHLYKLGIDRIPDNYWFNRGNTTPHNIMRTVRGNVKRRSKQEEKEKENYISWEF